MTDRFCDVLVVGDGPGADAAAEVAAQAGAAVTVVPDAAVWGAFALDEIAAIVDGRSAAFRGRRVVLALQPYPLGAGYAAETGLARALGAAHRVVAPGVLETVVDAAGRSSVAGLFVVAGIGDAAAVQEMGARAGAAAALELGFGQERPFVPVPVPVPVPEPATAAMDAILFPDAMVVCPGEGVTAGAVRAALRGGAQSVPAVKRATRAGMGRCQGRLCGPALQTLCGGAMAGEARFNAPRAPLHPVPVSALMREEAARVEPIDDIPASRWPTVPAAVPPASCDVLVIGGGVVGLSAALYLAQAGVDVVVADRGEAGLGASTANAGSLHVQLVPYVFQDGDPGPLGEALALGPRSIALWRELAALAGESFGIRTEGGLVLATDADDLAWLGRKAAFERARGVDVQIIGPGELAALSPGLARSYAGAAFCAAEGQIDPLRGTMALARLAAAAGARIVAGVTVERIEAEGARWMVQTAGGVVRAGRVLNAAGAHAGQVGRMAGVTLPVRAVVQQVIATAPAAPVLRHLVAQVRRNLSLKQTEAGHVLVGGGWPGRLGADGVTRLERRSIQGNLWTAVQALPALAGMEAVRAWTGLTVHLDRGPVIAETPGRTGLFHAVTTNGYTLGPVAGRLIADAMLGRGVPPRAFAL